MEEEKPDESAILKRLDVLEMHIGELLVKVVKAGAGAKFLARLALSFGSDTVSWLTEQRLSDSQSKAQYLAEIEKQTEAAAHEYLMKPE